MTTNEMSRWKAIGWTVAFFVSGAVLMMLALALLGALFPTIDQLMAGVVGQLVGFGVASWLIGGLALKWGWADLRYSGSGNGWKGFGTGLLFGAAPAVVGMTLAVPVAGSGWSLDGGTFTQWVGAVGGLSLLLLPAAFSEEVMFRGVGYVALTRAFGRLGPAIALSVLFGAAHLANPGITPLAVGNIALAGIYLSAALWLPGGMWAATGVHLGWNLTLAALGAPVSGLAFTLPMLDYSTGSPAWLTGGAFGPEGGVLATAIVGAGSVWLFQRTKHNAPGTV